MRLQEETEFRPKPLVPVGGQPILWHIMKCYSHYGYNDFVLCLGYKGDIIKNYFLNYETMSNDFTINLGSTNKIEYNESHDEQDFSVTLADTGLETMTGGRIKRIARYIKDDTFMVTYGDGISDINIGDLVDYHNSHKKLATLTAVRPTSRFGILSIDSSSMVQRFSEKPQTNEWINAGYFVFNREVFNYLKDDQCILERDPLEQLAREGELMAYKHDGFFYAMDTYRDYIYINDMWDSGETPWKKWK